MTETLDVAETSEQHRILSSAGPEVLAAVSHAAYQITKRVPVTLVGMVRTLLDEVSPLYLNALRGDLDVSPRDRARLRAAGEAWAATGLPLEELFGYFSDCMGALATALTAHVRPGLRQPVIDVIGMTNQFTREFLIGVGQARPRMLRPHPEPGHPADVLTGRRLSAEAPRRRTGRYLVAVVRPATDQSGSSLPATLRSCGGDGTFVVNRRAETVGVFPEHDRQRGRWLAMDLEKRLGTQAWIALTVCEQADLPDGYRQATEILDLVRAARRPPGLYKLDDVLLEHAVVHCEKTSRILSGVLEPLTEHTVLYETLEALADTDFNRNLTAKNLFIHRSTLEYRLSRITAFTGYDPMTSLGKQVLGTAVATQGIEKAAGGVMVSSVDEVVLRAIKKVAAGVIPRQ